MLPNAIEVVTLFVGDMREARSFYDKLFTPEIVYEDEVSAVLSFAGVLINLLQSTEALELVKPASVATPASGVRVLLTIRVENVDAICARLRSHGVALLNVRSTGHGGAAPRPSSTPPATSGKLRRNFDRE